MRSFVVTVVVTLCSSSALAHESGEEHAHNGETQGDPARAPKVSLTGTFGGLVGASLGGDYEECGEGTTCQGRKRPFSTLLELRGGYQFADGLGFEVGFGIISSASIAVTRETKLRGEGRALVDVNIRDVVSVFGPYVVGGPTYQVISKPVVVTAVIGFGAWFAKGSSERSGTVVGNDPPQVLNLSQVQQEAKETFLFLMPEARVAYPVLRNLEVGLSLGGLLAIGEMRPAVKQTATPGTATVPGSNPPRAIGFVPQPNETPETSVDNPFFFRTGLFVRGVF